MTDLQVSYGGIEALKGISFDVEEGEIVTLIGANGAGKSTTLRAISGLVQAKGRHASSMTGEDITGMDHAEDRRGAASRWCPRDGTCSPT